MQRALVVSIHDVAPATRARADQIVRRIADLGASVASLLVVPDYHHEGRAMSDPAFCVWLHELEERGHEVVLHGFFHQRSRRPAESRRDQFITRFYTADEGEFFDLGYEQALTFLEDAQRDFAAQDFRPRGFIPPAWLLGAEAERAVIDAGFTYTTTLRRVRDFVAREEFAAQSLVYSVRSSWRRGVSLGWNRWLFSRLTGNALLRLSLHPPDLAHPEIWRQIEGLIKEALLDRVATTYAAWLENSVLPSEVPRPRSGVGESRGSRTHELPDKGFAVAPRNPSTSLHSARDDGNAA